MNSSHDHIVFPPFDVKELLNGGVVPRIVEICAERRASRDPVPSTSGLGTQS